MKSSRSLTVYSWLITFLILCLVARPQLTPDFYSSTCPDLLKIVRKEVQNAIKSETRVAASLLLEIHFSFGGPNWTISLGRRDGKVPNQAGANSDLVGPFENISSINTKFANVGLNLSDVVSLSGAHKIGLARCGVFNVRLFNFSGSGAPDSRIEPTMLSVLQNACPLNGDGNKTVPLDRNSIDLFDNQYFKNLLNEQGLFASDQSLATGDEDLTSTTKSIVELYSNDGKRFFDDFANSMIKMGNLSPLTGSDREIGKNCRVVNS